MSGASEGPPTVLVVAHPDAPPGVLREVRAGAEEQGVPTGLLPDDGSGGADAAARRGAADSRLHVGVGVAADGAVAVRHALVPRPVLTLSAGAGAVEQRQAGADAARIVAGGALRAGGPGPL